MRRRRCDSRSARCEIDRNYSAAYDLVGAAHTKLGQPQPAREAFLASLRFDPHDSTAYTNLGVLALNDGDAAAAADYFAEALWLDEDSALAREGLNRATRFLGSRFRSSQSQFAVSAVRGSEDPRTPEPRNLEPRNPEPRTPNPGTPPNLGTVETAELRHFGTSDFVQGRVTRAIAQPTSRRNRPRALGAMRMSGHFCSSRRRRRIRRLSRLSFHSGRLSDLSRRSSRLVNSWRPEVSRVVSRRQRILAGRLRIRYSPSTRMHSSSL